jgi:hypothetical protein
MEITRGSVVLVDTNVILEAHRVGAWTHLASWYALETESECVAECETGNQRRSVPIPIDTARLEDEVIVHRLPYDELVRFRLRMGAEPSLDPGEERLIASALLREDVWLICSPDKAAVRACHKLGMLDQVVALEDLTLASGLRVRLRDSFTCHWLSDFRTKLLLDM